MIGTFSAREFLRPAERGGNFPMLIRGVDAGGQAASIFVKTKAAYGERVDAPGIELFTTLFARSVGLKAPEPVIVDVDTNFYAQVHNAERHRELLERSPGLNFGSIALGEDWKTWLTGMPVEDFLDPMEDILVFDSIVQHTDRTPENPNLMWKGLEIAVIDHEKCFAYTSLGSGSWKEFFLRRGLDTHCLYKDGQALTGEGFGQRIWEKLLEIQIDGQIEGIADIAVRSFPESEVAIGRITRYIKTVANEFEDFLKHVIHTLDR